MGLKAVKMGEKAPTRKGVYDNLTLKERIRKDMK